jgi:hypothetical protein
VPGVSRDDAGLDRDLLGVALVVDLLDDAKHLGANLKIGDACVE